MFLIVLVLVAAIAGCLLFDKKIHETIPPALFIITLVVYVCALVLPLPAAVWICVSLTAVTLAGIIALKLIARKKSEVKVPIKGLIWRFLTPQTAILVVVCFVFCLVMSEHRAFFYDDLSYWAIYTKDIFSIDKLPHLFENCSVNYKDYPPIIQIMQYIAMFGHDTFPEAVMFQANVCLIYVLLLPLLHGIEDRNRPVGIRASAVAMYVILPHILTSQFYFRLGVDLFLAFVFGYILFCIIDPDSILGRDIFESKDTKDDLFDMVCIVTGLSFLSLIKSSGIVLCIFAIIVFLSGQIAQKSGRRTIMAKNALLLVFSFGSYYSWQLFLKYSWNNGYLSDRVKAGVTGTGLTFPDYTEEVILNYIRNFFTYPLTESDWGVTAFVLVAFIGLVFFVTITAPLPYRNKKPYKAMFAASMIGLLLFCIAHLFMYLFVFDDWEAHGLLEFNRYITQYLGGLFYVFAYNLIAIAAFGIRSQSRDPGQNATILSGLVAIFIALLPYQDMTTYLLPLNYYEEYERSCGEVSRNAEIEWKESEIASMGLSRDGTQRLTLIADSWDEETQFLVYEAVPQPIDDVINVPAIESGDIVSFTEDRLEQYVYVAKNAPDSYEGDWKETAELTADGRALHGGTLYRLVKENDTKTLVPADK